MAVPICPLLAIMGETALAQRADIARSSTTTADDATASPATRDRVAYMEFLPPPGCIPPFTHGPGGQLEAHMELFRNTVLYQEHQALADATLFMRDGELDFLLYNYLFLCTINKDLAVQGLHKRMQELAAPPKAHEAASHTVP